MSRTALMLAMLTSLLAGCAGSEGEASSGSSLTITPADFHKPPAAGTAPSTSTDARPAAGAAPARDTTAGAPVLGAAPRPPVIPAPAAGAPAAVTMDAMVGQVNGKPIYASTIFKALGEDVFVRLGQEKTRLDFRAAAKELIDSDLRSRIQNQLLLAEAEKSLSEREQMGLLEHLVRERERLLARYGGGVQAIAEENLRKERGNSIEDEIEAIRQRQLTGKFLQDKIYPKIHINKRDVERYFQDHIKEFQQDPSVTVRLLVAPNERAAAEVEKGLAAGVPFEELAKEHSVVRPEQGGLMPPYKTAVEAFKELRWNDLNEAVRALKEGQTSPKIKIDLGHAWVKLDNVEGGEKREFKDVQLQIESLLKAMRFNQLTRKYMGDLMTSGNFTPIDQMSAALLDVAMTRFARTQ